MDLKKLKNHVKLCKKNLASKKVKCCAECPFEEEITDYYPELKELFEAKRESRDFVSNKAKELIKIIDCDAFKKREWGSGWSDGYHTVYDVVLGYNRKKEPIKGVFYFQFDVLNTYCSFTAESLTGSGMDFIQDSIKRGADLSDSYPVSQVDEDLPELIEKSEKLVKSIEDFVGFPTTYGGKGKITKAEEDIFFETMWDEIHRILSIKHDFALSSE